MGERIRALRRAADMTQAELASLCGCHQGTIASIERGKKSPSINLARKIGLALNTTIDYIVNGKPKQEAV